MRGFPLASPWRLAALLFLLLAIRLPGARAESGPTLEASREPQQNITVGDPIRLTLQADLPEGWQVRFPTPGGTLGDFTVLGAQSPPPSEMPDKRSRHSWVLQVAAYRPGRFEIPSLSVSFTDPSGKKQERSTTPMPVEVISVLQEKSPELRDLKGQEVLYESYLWLWLGLAGALLAAAAAWWIRRRWQKRQTPSAASFAAPLLPPHEEARGALDRLLAGPLTPRDPLFYLHLSEIIRRMIGRQFEVAALEYTTAELMAALAALPGMPLPAGRLEPFLGQCDLIKFAQYLPAAEEQTHLVSEARAFILCCRQAWEKRRAEAEAEARAGLPAQKPNRTGPV